MTSASTFDRAAFLARFGDVFEHSPWVAEAAFDHGLPCGPLTAESLHQAMCAILHAAPHARQLALINSHPDLAGKLALDPTLTDASKAEQSSAGLNRLTEEEFTRFTTLNNAYKERFGFVFILAVRGKSKADILAAFEQRLSNDLTVEFAKALEQITQITRMRLDVIFAAPSSKN